MKRILLPAAVMIAVLIVAGWQLFFRPAVTFDGDRIRNTDPERFTLRFDMMNADDSETMTLREGDTLHVTWQIEDGSVDVLVSLAGETPLYQANGRGKGDTADFRLTVRESGDYTISISARKAKGRMSFEQEK